MRDAIAGRRAQALQVALAVLVLLSVACAGNGATATSAAPAGPAGGRSLLPDSLPPSTGRTYYVATTGDDANAGTRARPWRTVQKALATLRPGQRAFVRGGVYMEDLVFRRAGTAAAPITVAAAAGERVVLRPASTSGDTYPVRIRGSYFRLRGFVIENARGTSSTNVYFEGDAHDVELAGNDIRGSQDQGIFAERTTRNLHIVRNQIHDNGRGHVEGQHQSHGIYLEGADHLVANNVVWNHPFGFGIQIYPENEGTIVVHNTIVGSGHSGIVVGGDDGVGDIVIRNNILAFNSGYGVESDSDCPTGPVAVDRNVIFGNRGGAVESGCANVTVTGGNIVRDPRFVAPGRNFDLKAGSPAIDRARPDYSPRVDLRGRRRPSGRGYDVGALERYPRRSQAVVSAAG
jgi:hypothetical protein